MSKILGGLAFLVASVAPAMAGLPSPVPTPEIAPSFLGFAFAAGVVYYLKGRVRK